jgi:Secretion system C-terminal sorting domain/Pregnancy-associated plasma protein-A
MLKNTLILIAILIFNISFGQQTGTKGYCGTTELSEDQQEFLRNFQAGIDEDFEYMADAQYYIPVKIHIVGDDDGNGYFPSHDALRVVCDLNDAYAPVGFHFYIYGDLNYLNNSTYYEHTFNQGSVMMRDNNVAGVINIYIVNDPAGQCGYYSPFRDALSVAKSCSGRGSQTLPHELGHYFSLPHPFNGWEGGAPSIQKREKVDRSNCKTTGDGFCDTPSDYYADRWNCPKPTNLKYDPNGDTVVPDGELYMSYANDGCQNKFSPQQMGAMRANLVTNRKYLISKPTPSDGVLTPVNLLTPVNSTQNIPSNQVPLSWNKVENATRYHVQASQVPNMIFAVVDVFVTDTSYMATTGFLASKRYFWRVKAMTGLNHCEDYSAPFNFVTGLPVGINDLGLNQPEVLIYPNPVGSGQSIRIDFQDNVVSGQIILMDLNGRSVRQVAISNDQNLTIPLENIPAGVYLVHVQSDDFQLTRRLVIFD